jgi:hypothetical protein
MNNSNTTVQGQKKRGPQIDEEGEEADSQPLDFDTFVPSYNPLPFLPQTTARVDYTSHLREAHSGMIVDQDEAFSRALGAMYWSGYWTAMYNVCFLFPPHWGIYQLTRS